LDNYFITLKSVLVDNNLLDKPECIYNVDESGVPLEHRSPLVITKRGQHKVRYCTSGNKSQITVVACIKATGQCMPPFIIFDAKNLNIDWTRDEVPGTTYGLSDNGWIDTILFKEWFFRHFLKHAGSARPLLLLLDGHSSHYNMDVITMARDNDVIIFTLVPHTTHEMQPLDTAVFGPFKTRWQEACHHYIQKNPGRVITKYTFNTIFSEAWLNSLVPANIVSGFKTCGVYPFNPKAVLDHNPCEMNKSNSQSSGSSTSKGDSLNASGSSHREFTDEEESRFARRYREGYDLTDPRYSAWLKVNYPAEQCQEQELSQYFSDVLPLEPVDMSAMESISSECENADLQATVTDVTPGLTPTPGSFSCH